MNSTQRILEIFLALYQGDTLSVDYLIQTYQVSRRTIQRDLSFIKSALFDESCPLQLQYDEFRHGYTMVKRDHLHSEEVLVLCKILLESRAVKKSLTIYLTNYLPTQVNN